MRRLVKPVLIALAMTCGAQALAAGPMTAQPAEGGTHLVLPGEVRLLGPAETPAPLNTVIVNGTTITAADVEQRLALAIAAGRLQLSAHGLAQARAAVQRRLIDETLQIQAAAAEDIAIEPAEIDRLYSRLAANAGRTPAQFTEDLRASGSSDGAARRQLRAALAWLRLQRSQIEDGIYDPEEDARTIVAGFNTPFGSVQESGEADGTIMNLVHLSLAVADDAAAARAGDSLRALVAGGCGNALTAARGAGAAIFTDAHVPVRDLPMALQQPMLDLRVGQASPPFRSEQSVGILILCGRDHSPPLNAGDPNSIFEMRIARRAQRWLRDLRRDAVIEYR
jgi:peptidyl-prolyl cis-trans isomerase SurA